MRSGCEGEVTSVSSEGSLAEAKRALRAHMRERRAGLEHALRMRKSLAIETTVIATKEYQQAACVMLYASSHDEVHTFSLIERALADGKVVVLPRMAAGENLEPHVVADTTELRRNRFEILEPLETAPRASLGDIDVAIVPGVAFDDQCNRLGMGKGCYDKLLPRIEHATRIGLAFEEQLIESVPCEEHDAHVDVVVTEKRVLHCR